MGKNQAYKAMQRSRFGSSSAAPDEVEDSMVSLPGLTNTDILFQALCRTLELWDQMQKGYKRTCLVWDHVRMQELC
ncbi:uncharacterized protein LOC125197498 isoform X2 [Salvia hispanica]|uniref:uncharacterized protein LOC125197498 isoform X2 n=1 Tax=Salvia hispanica TaxID=49212 RepID=UPI0020095D41|nr:uncharacterized protein LOC125197498 isoform X2 [Salvia hispanica]